MLLGEEAYHPRGFNFITQEFQPVDCTKCLNCRSSCGTCLQRPSFPKWFLPRRMYEHRMEFQIIHHHWAYRSKQLQRNSNSCASWWLVVGRSRPLFVISHSFSGYTPSCSTFLRVCINVCKRKVRSYKVRASSHETERAVYLYMHSWIIQPTNTAVSVSCFKTASSYANWATSALLILPGRSLFSISQCKSASRRWVVHLMRDSFFSSGGTNWCLFWHEVWLCGEDYYKVIRWKSGWPR